MSSFLVYVTVKVETNRKRRYCNSPDILEQAGRVFSTAKGSREGGLRSGGATVCAQINGCWQQITVFAT